MERQGRQPRSRSNGNGPRRQPMLSAWTEKQANSPRRCGYDNGLQAGVLALAHPTMETLAWVCGQQQVEASSLWSPTVPPRLSLIVRSAHISRDVGGWSPNFEFGTVSLFGFRARRLAVLSWRALAIKIDCWLWQCCCRCRCRCRCGCRTEDLPAHQAVLAGSHVAGGPSSTKPPLSFRLRKSVLFLEHRRTDRPDNSKA